MTDQPKSDRPDGDRLLPCPGCECADTRIEEIVSSGEWRARCERCGLQTCWWHSEQEARDHWNTRASPSPTRDGAEGTQMKCPTCGDDVTDIVHALDCDRHLQAAPPKPAPDALDALRKIVDEYDRFEREQLQLDEGVEPAIEAARRYLAAPVPPADGARRYCPNGLEHGICLHPDCVSSCPGRLAAELPADLTRRAT